MKIAYLIMAHNNPNHLKRLIDRLSTPNSTFFIHIDGKVNALDFLQVSNEKVIFIKDRIPIFYGDYSILNATLHLLENSLANKSNNDYHVLLSGNDYPIQPTKYIEQFFEINNGKEFVDISPFDLENSNPANRISKYQISNNVPIILQRVSSFFTKKRFTKLERIKKFQNFNLLPYWGSAWWALTRNTCKYVLDYMKHEKEFARFMKEIRFPEEMVFQLIIGNSSIKTNSVGNITYIDWSKKQTHPAEINQTHIDTFRNNSIFINGNSQFLFARKFSDNYSEIVDKLDSIISEKEKHYRL